MIANIKDTAKALCVSEYFLRREAKAGRIPVWKSGKKYIFDVELVRQFLRDKCMENIKPEENGCPSQSGTLRKVNP